MPIVASLKTLGEAIFCTVVFLVFSNYFWIEFCYTANYAEYSLLGRFFYFYMAMNVKKFFYYGPFLFTTGAFQAIGLGYHGKDKNGVPKWDRVFGVDWFKIESINSVAQMFVYWNHQVHLWLKFYILARI